MFHAIAGHLYGTLPFLNRRIVRMLDRSDPSEDDPFEELASSACNLLADSLGVRYCGIINADESVLRASSSDSSPTQAPEFQARRRRLNPFCCQRLRLA